MQGCFAVLRGPFGADVGLRGVNIDGTAEFKGLRPGLHTLLVFAPNQPVIAKPGLLVKTGETTTVEVDIPAPPAADGK